jgi:hypothetical protein
MPSKLIKISSIHKQSNQSSNDFNTTINNCPQLAKAIRLSIKSIVIPNVGYNIKSTSNTFSYGLSGVAQTVVIPIGQYTIDELIAVLIADSTLSTAGFAITLNNITKKLQFTSTSNIDYEDISTNPMAKILGIETSTLNTLSYDSAGMVDLTSDKEIYVVSNTLANGHNLISSSTAKNLPVIAVVPINVGFGSMINYSTQHDDIDSINYPMNGINICNFGVALYNEHEELLDLHNHDWVMIVKIDHL